MPEPVVRTATRADVPAAANTLAAAFRDDPVLAYILPDEQGRAARAQRLFSMFGRIQLTHGHVYVRPPSAGTGAPDGVAIWVPPGEWKIAKTTIARILPSLVRVFGVKVVQSLTVLDAIEKHHPIDPPHWYLEFLGTAQDRRGQGVATALVAPVLERADAEALPAYLENSNEANLGLYRRLDFEVTGTFTLPRGGPTMWSMWREPRPE